MEMRTEQISETLIYEEFGGRKYQDVLLGLKKESEIMGRILVWWALPGKRPTGAETSKFTFNVEFTF